MIISLIPLTSMNIHPADIHQFILHCARFALSLHKISCVSAMKIKVRFTSFLFCIALGLHYLCRQIGCIRMGGCDYFTLTMRKIILVTGGQRSGKSVCAERLALSLSPSPVYIATAHVWDDEFALRVERHKQRRGPQWQNIEEEKYLSRYDIHGKVAVIDCVTLWCTNFFFDRDAGDRQPTVDEALAGLKKEFDRFVNQDATFIFVTNEIGSGEVSGNAVQRRFTDLQGWMNQYVASKADEVVLMVCGIPVPVKGGDIVRRFCSGT